MALTREQVRHIARLARLRLTDEEVTLLTSQLTGILQYVDMLGEVDTTGIEATAQVTGLKNALREDIVRTEGAAPDLLLGTSPLPLTDRQIVTPSAHG